MQKIVNNLAIEYSDEGKGPVILMLHGWGDNLHTFDSISKELQESYRIVRIDLPGFGNSQMPKNDWYLNDYIDLVQQFIEKIDINPNIIIGHSFGGRITIKGVAEKILNPEKIILIASAGIYKSSSLKNRVIKAIAKTGKAITSILPGQEKIRELFYEKIKSDYNDNEDLKETFLNIIQEDLKNNAKKITQPTLLIWGENDDVTPTNDAQTLNKIIPNSKLEIIKDTGHFVHQEKADEVVKLIKSFNE